VTIRFEIPKTTMLPAQSDIEESSGSPDFCVHDLIRIHAKRKPDAVAIVAPRRASLTYGRLRVQLDDMAGKLRALGIGRRDRVALALPNGPELAVAFLAVAAAAVCAPLDPNARAEDVEFWLSDLKVKALIVQAGCDSPARTVALARGLTLIELSPILGAEAGLFTLRGRDTAQPARPRRAEPDDTALLLHAVGTEARPRVVPLTHRQLCASGFNIGASLRLLERDRCLSVLPLYRSHGLVGAVITSLVAGASIVCSPEFNAGQIFRWLQEFRPSWLTATPAMLQAILACSDTQREIIACCPLRFLRSSSSALPPGVMGELERVFKAPVLEAYGLTEAAHQVAGNPLPPQIRKPGSVGLATGPEVAIMDSMSNLIAPELTGEIVIRGENVIAAYENNPTANQAAFAKEWLRTGDEGHLDKEGYLFITGRLKQVINCAGEKISAREVEEALLRHPAVSQAVAFAVPVPVAGEEVAVAVVLREHRSASEAELSEFAAQLLSGSKIPRHIRVVTDLPKAASGAALRVGLAERLGLGRKADESVSRAGTAWQSSGADS